MEKLGPKHVDVATSYTNLASIYKYLGDLEQAKEYQQRALDIKLDKPGQEHVNVARSYNNLALIYKKVGDFEQAKEYQQLAVVIRADNHGRNKTPSEVRTANRRKKLHLFNLWKLYFFLKDFT